MATLQQMDPYIGKYYSNEWVRKHVLYQSDKDIEEMDEQIIGEQENPMYQQQTDENGNPVAPGDAPPSMNTTQSPGGGGFGSATPAN